MAALGRQIKWAELKQIDVNNDPEIQTVMPNDSKQPCTHANKTIDGKTSGGGQNEIKQEPQALYHFKGQAVHLHRDSNLCVRMGDSDIMSALYKLSSISHENILTFVGLIRDDPKCVLTEETTWGSLYDLLGNYGMRLTQDFKVAFLFDVVSGMNYLHNSDVGYHGHLSSKWCYLDSKFTCKIGNYWLTTLSNSLYQSACDTDDPENMLWMAPEVLHSQNDISKKCDVYSFGIMIQEIMLQSKPYANNDPPLHPREIIKQVSDDEQQLRPVMLGLTSEWVELASKCWDQNPNLRPTFSEVNKKLIRLNMGKRNNAVESMVDRLEAHTQYLEEVVELRSSELVAEKALSENLICELLPRCVFEQLKQGKQVKPETFEQVTMFFSDIEGFTKIAASSSPMEIVSLLNRLYTLFDNAIVNYDAYKVATIGDAYIIVSGLPERNGDRHAGEIASLALELIDLIDGFEISHIPGTFLNMRVGLHSGPCVAAITGLKMPRYLLFGDIVNIGARIEALGKSMMVHMSDTTTGLLAEDQRFVIEQHETKLDVPGYGEMQTSWLTRNANY